MVDKLRPYTLPSLFGSALFVIIAMGVLPKTSSSYKDLIIPAISGFLSGSLFRYFFEQARKASQELRDLLDQLRASGKDLARISTFLRTQKEFKEVDQEDDLQLWAMHSAFKYAWMIPAGAPEKAREKFCEYLKEGLTHCEQWLGIHEDRLSFFFGPETKGERKAYMEELRKFRPPKTRVLVVNNKNRDDFVDYNTIKDYLKSVDGHNILTYAIDQTDFDIIVRPWRNKSFKDWALYDNSVLLEFNEEERVISFHVKDSLVDGIDRLRQGLNSGEYRNKVTLIDSDYLRKIRNGKRAGQPAGAPQPASNRSE